MRDALAENASDVDKQIYAYYDVVAENTVAQSPNLPNDQEFIDNFKSISQSIAFGQITCEQGAQDLYDLVQRLMVK